MKKVVCIVGPTASGKSKLSEFLAENFPAEIINADSRQFYREFEIGTARPSLSASKIPHHLVGVASLADSWDVGRFVKNAEAAIDDIASRGRLPLIVGGTGMYMKCLLFGLDHIPKITEKTKEDINKKLHAEGVEALYVELLRVDPQCAALLSRNDKQRVGRALGVYRETGQSITTFWSDEEKPARFAYLKIGLNLNRVDLYRRINARVDDMMARGLKEEVLNLHRQFAHSELLQKTIGYQEWIQLGFENDKKVVEHIKKNSRHFAKRQLTWFRHENDVHWYSPEQRQEILTRVKDFC